MKSPISPRKQTKFGGQDSFRNSSIDFLHCQTEFIFTLLEIIISGEGLKGRLEGLEDYTRACEALQIDNLQMI